MAENMNNAPVVETEDISVEAKGQFKEFIRRFRKNRPAVAGALIVCVLAFCALFPGLLVGSDYISQDLMNLYASPSAAHPFGLDELGRDVLTRVIWGARTSLSIGAAAVTISSIFGIILGCIAGFFGGKIDNIIMRLLDILMAVPNTLLGISIVAALGASVKVLIIAMAISGVPGSARIVRSAVITVRDSEFIEAARSTGASNFRIITKYVLPNSLSPIIVQISMGLATSIMSVSGLSFLGLGVPAPTPEWGSMMTQGRAVIRDYPHIILFPGIAIMLTVFGFNLLGDGLRDALDPRLKT